MKRFSGLVVVACLPFLAASAAQAKAPPVAKYDCVISSNILFGTLGVLAGGKYTHRGTHGTFTTAAAPTKFKDGKVGYTIRFKGGSLNGISGRWYRASAGGGKTTYEIALKNPRDNFESIYCDKT
ncbi:MAG TPA: hypothetical protein VJT84_11395 [Gaiellaceae bacterium]|nr:hypothetical protein [Gaiellaceae bacterium]